MTKRTAGAITLTIGVLIAGTAMASAQDIKVAVVDMRGVIEEYVGWQQRIADLNQFRLEREQQYRSELRTAYLTPEEKDEYRVLRRDPAPTLDRLQRRIELLERSAQREDELTSLSKIDDTELTPEQRKRRDELQALHTQAQQYLDELRKRLNKEIDEKDRELAEEADTEIRSAIEAYAKEKQFDLVLSKDTVVWGGTDITKDIVDRLNKAG